MMQAYECFACPRLGFFFAPGDCPRCDRRLQPAGGVV